jgi:hypothetical protein
MNVDGMQIEANVYFYAPAILAPNQEPSLYIYKRPQP